MYIFSGKMCIILVEKCVYFGEKMCIFSFGGKMCMFFGGKMCILSVVSVYNFGGKMCMLSVVKCVFSQR